MRGNPHAAFEVAGAGNVAWSRWCDTRKRKGEPTGNTNIDLTGASALDPTCVQRRLVCSAGIKPAGAKVRRPVAWMAGWRETETLKPIDKVSLGEIASHRAVMRVNAKWPRKQMNPRAEPANEGRRQHGMPKSDRCGILISAG